MEPAFDGLVLLRRKMPLTRRLLVYFHSGAYSITEGFHNKMELINRQAYGFRNFENYRLRVKVLCG